MLAQAGEFVGPDVGWWALSPLLVLVGGALVLLVAGAVTPPWPKSAYAVTTTLVAAGAAVLAVIQWQQIRDDGPSLLVGDAIAYDQTSVFFTVTICASVGLVALLSDDFLRRHALDGPEFYALYLVAATGGIVMASANDLIVLFIGIETLSLALYVLAAADRRRTKSQESGLKYFVLGGFSSACLLYGIALVYGATGSTNISGMVEYLQGTVPLDRQDALIFAGIALLMVGLGFKVAAAPFHVWTPDVYQGAPSPVSALMASAGKVAAFGAIVRVLIVGLPFYRDDWRPVVWVLAVASMVIGSVLAVVQHDIKRLLAYSSISHAGFVLVGIEAAAHQAGGAEPGRGIPSVGVYLLAYSVMVIGSFGVVAIASRSDDEATTLDSFRGFAARRPALAVAFTVFLLAQAGVPFTSGFIAKFGVIQAAVEERSYAIALIAMVASVIAAFLYLRIIVSMWMGDADADVGDVALAGAGRSRTWSGSMAIGLAALFTIAIGVVPGWLLEAADSITGYASR